MSLYYYGVTQGNIYSQCSESKAEFRNVNTALFSSCCLHKGGYTHSNKLILFKSASELMRVTGGCAVNDVW